MDEDLVGLCICMVSMMDPGAFQLYQSFESTFAKGAHPIPKQILTVTQHVVPLPHQRLPIIHHEHFDTIRHIRLPRALFAHCHYNSVKLHGRRSLHPNS